MQAPRPWGSRGPSPAITATMLGCSDEWRSVRCETASASCITPFSGTKRPALAMSKASLGILSSARKSRELACERYSSASMALVISPQDEIPKWESHSLAFCDTAKQRGFECFASMVIVCSTIFSGMSRAGFPRVRCAEPCSIRTGSMLFFLANFKPRILKG